MARVYVNLVAGQISNNPLSSGGTTLNGAFLASLPAVSGGDYIVLVLDPQGLNGAPEIVRVTAHTASATSATILRAQEGTSARSHPENTRVVAPVTADDLNDFVTDIAGLTSTVAGHTSSISTIQGNLSTAEGDIDDLEVDVEDLVQAVAALQEIAAGAVPTGTILPYAGATAPSGFRLCNGDEISRSTYSELFNRIGTTFGNGNGSTTFNVPDLRGRYPFGVALSGTGNSRGATFGSIDHTHSIAAHDHGVGSLATASNGAHSHTVSATIGNASVGSDLDVNTSGLMSRTNVNGHLHHQSATTGSGGSHSHPSAGTHTHTAAGEPTSSAGSHSHSSAGSHSHSLGSTGNGDGGDPAKQHSHSISASTGSTGAHTHTISGSVASGGPTATGANNPPSLALNFIIKT